MPLPETIKVSLPGDNPLAEGDAKVCGNCGNIYRIVWLKEGDDYNDFRPALLSVLRTDDP